MTRVDRAVLEYLADLADPFASLFELRSVLDVWGERPENLAIWLRRWLVLGWITLTPADEAEDEAFVSLTDAGRTALAALPPAS